jgi:signal transduction histidine kinase
MKYSRDEKYINICLTHHSRNLLVSIEDHGVGIPRKSIKHVFEKFYRAEDALTAHTKGHGLGLSIVKNLVEQNGGAIQVESEEGMGATFFVTFPVFMEPGAQSAEVSQSEHPTSKITSDSPNYVGKQT